MSALHPLLRRALALTLLLASVALLWLVVLQPLWRQYVAYGESIEHSRDLLARYVGIAEGEPRLAELLAQLKAQRQATSGALHGESVELAGAEMQEQVKRIVEDGGGQLNSSQMLTVENSDRLQKLGLRVVMSGDIAAVQRALYALEASDPYFFVDRLNIQASRVGTRLSRGARSRRLNYDLQVSFDVFSYLKMGG